MIKSVSTYHNTIYKIGNVYLTISHDTKSKLNAIILFSLTIFAPVTALAIGA